MSTTRLVTVPTNPLLWDVLRHSTPRHRLEVMNDVMDILLSDGNHDGTGDTFSCIIAIQADNADEYRALANYYSRLCEIVEGSIDAVLWDIEYETPEETRPTVRDMGINRRYWYFTVDYMGD